MEGHAIGDPSAWVVRWTSSLAPSSRVLDVACGGGRHARYLAGLGHAVTAIDRDPPSIPGVRCLRADLEDGGPWPLAGEVFDAVVVANYLHRPLFPALAAALAPGGVLLYETFMAGNERFGRPSSPAFLLRPGELWSAFDGLQIVAFEQGLARSPKPAMRQRLCARRPPNG
jgi:SAM-dependent methyltransferase